MENQEIYCNVVYLADTGGTGFWRRVAPIATLDCLTPQLRMLNTYSMAPVSDPNWYRGIRSVTVQRWLTDEQRQFIQKFLRPIANQMGFWLVYEIDDATGAAEVPLYNRGHDAFCDPQRQENIRQIMLMCDLVTVTTTHLKEYVNKTYGVPLERIIAVPNLLPNWWIGDRFQPEQKVKQLNKYHTRPRIGIISSLSHFNIQRRLGEDNKELQDDIHTVLDVMKETADDVKWVVLGYAHPELKEYFDNGKMEYHPCVPILQYPSRLQGLELQGIVVPLLDNEFNRCKSPIKYLEGCALGVPVFCPDMLPYSGVVPERQIYKNQGDLKDKLLKLKFMSSGAYQKMIQGNWDWLNSPHEDGNCKLNNYWLEGNLGIWIDLFKLPSRTKKGNTKND